MLKFLIVVICNIVSANIYFHNMRGSNNRHDESSRERKNANRLFNSQNNDRGGYNVGETMTFFQDSIIEVEWTNQHQCSGNNSNCNIILQYMCNENIRDGHTTRYGMHEPYENYLFCKSTNRNKGLFTADQDLKGDSAIYTRQNPNGTRYGYECPEERDYWPYWRPTPWIDLAIFSDDITKCEEDIKESQNNKPKFQCVPAFNKKIDHLLPLTEEECDARHYFWAKVRPWRERIKSYTVPRPECVKAPPSRDNHSGNGPSGQPNRWSVIIPKGINGTCVMRIRYNISTADYAKTHDASYNKGAAKEIKLAEKVGLDSEAHARAKGYEFKNDPTIDPLFDYSALRGKLKLALAIDTSQFGRTFQDRTHKTYIRPRIDPETCTKIHNVNVRGKRGNIVQVYPAVEYDFVPNKVLATEGDCVHFQWTGSDNNNKGNAGQGQKRTDRSNVIEIANKTFESYYNNDSDASYIGCPARNYPKMLNESTFLGFDEDTLTQLAFSGSVSNGPLLDSRQTTPYFNLGVKPLTKSGNWSYICTRNNAFTNRSQKGYFCVEEKESASNV